MRFLRDGVGGGWLFVQGVGETDEAENRQGEKRREDGGGVEMMCEDKKTLWTRQGEGME